MSVHYSIVNIGGIPWVEGVLLARMPLVVLLREKNNKNKSSIECAMFEWVENYHSEVLI